MRTLGQLLIGLLLAVPSVRAASVPWDLERSDVEEAASIARAVERRLVVLHSTSLAVYLEGPSAQLHIMAELPILRELVRSLRLRELERALAAAGPTRARSCQGRPPSMAVGVRLKAE